MEKQKPTQQNIEKETNPQLIQSNEQNNKSSKKPWSRKGSFGRLPVGSNSLGRYPIPKRREV